MLFVLMAAAASCGFDKPLTMVGHQLQRNLDWLRNLQYLLI